MEVNKMETIMKKLMVLLAVILFPLACDKSPVETTAIEKNERQDVHLTAKQEVKVQNGNILALDYFKKMYAYNEERLDGKDFVVSPLGLEMLLGLLNTGATEEAADQILSVMGFEHGEEKELNEYLYSLLGQLVQLDALTRIKFANIGFINKAKFELKPSYVEEARYYYDMPVTEEDFSDPDLVHRINGWCNDNTEGMIPVIIGAVNPDGNFYMFDAMYFNGYWTSRFDPGKTEKEKFYPEKGDSFKVKMMKQQAAFPFAQMKDYSVVCLPYGNEAFRMNVILPHEGNRLEDVIASLDNDRWDGAVSRMIFTDLDIWLPRFETENYFLLNEIMLQLGLSGIYKVGNLDNLAKDITAEMIVQSTHIKVSEEGTEAAAVTGNISFSSPGPGHEVPPEEFHANRPFLYLITEYSTGAILFAGIYGGHN